MKDTSFGRIVGVLVSPTKTFRAIAERSTWLVAMLVLIGCGVVFWSAAAPKIDWEATVTTKLARAGREAEPEKLEAVMPFLEEHGNALMIGATVLTPWIFYPLLALIYRGLLKMAGGELSFRASFGVLLHSFMPGAVASLFVFPFLLGSAESINLYDPGSMVSNLSAFATAETGLALWTLLNNISLFTLWTIALLVIGYSIAANITKLRAAFCVVGLWAVWVALMVGLAALE
ncbi:MAG: YIP1 family protein [Acidobacteriota bacterium]|nr:YIP1 family protein [Acidobacteriota bacterium]